jgi:hypothetical protein
MFLIVACAALGSGTARSLLAPSMLPVGKAQDDLVQKYGDISALPMQKRKTAFRKASPKDRSDLWKTHLALYLVKHSELNEGQKEIILEGISFATPASFELPPDNPLWTARVGEPLRLLENRILAAFSKEEGARIFATLGDPEPATSASTTGSVASPKRTNPVESNRPSKHHGRVLNRSLGQDMVELGSNDCSCSTSSDWCWNYCGGSAPSCDRTQGGCGTFYQYACNGKCH